MGLNKFRKHLNKSHGVENLNSTLNTEHKFSTKSNDSLPDSDVITNVIVTESNFNSEDPNKNKIDKDLNDNVTSSILGFITNLYSKPNVTATLLQDIINEVSELFSNEIISCLKSKVIPLISMCKVSEINEVKNMFNM